jgi:hypothetical protein
MPSPSDDPQRSQSCFRVSETVYNAAREEGASVGCGAVDLAQVSSISTVSADYSRDARRRPGSIPTALQLEH